MMSFGERLKAARLKLNLTLAEVSQRTGIGESSLSEFENGKREPKISQLAQLADVYRRPMSFFLDDREVSKDTVLWRLRPEETAPLLEREFLKLCEQYRLLEEWNDDFIEPQLPRVGASRHALNYVDVADLARKVGSELNLGERPAFVLLRVLEEDCGIKIFHREFEPIGTAACVKSDQFGWAILLNARNSAGRRNFDLAHELFHLLVWDLYHGPDASSAATSHEQEEKLANAFASCLLIPAEALSRAVGRKRNAEGKVAVSDIPEIARQFGVSIAALLWRIHWVYNFGSARKEETRNIIAAIEKKQGEHSEPEDGSKPSILPCRYQTLATQALRNGEMSLGKFMEFMEISRREAMSYMETEEVALGVVQLTPA